MENSHPKIIFLGLCERAAYVREGNTNLFKWNVLGLKNIILSHIFPMKLDGWSIGLAFLEQSASDEVKLSITDKEGNEVGTVNILAEATAAPSADNVVHKDAGQIILVPEYGWTVAFLPLGENTIVINKPGAYYVNMVTEGEPTIIGQLQFTVIDPRPLTPERIAAIRSEPNAITAVRMNLGCKKCHAQLKIYAALERITKLEDEGCYLYDAIPDEFICDCGNTRMDLRIIRKNLHGFLGQEMRKTQDLNFVPLYEKSSLESIRISFANLLKSKPQEEILQQFIQENPILLHQFPAEQIFFKPKILTFFIADFAIITPQKELILIELETTDTRLMIKKGGVAAPLNHAFDQVRDWLHVVDEHRLAVLDALNIDRSIVSTIRGVVIAGRDIGYDAQHLRRLKGADWGRITLLTYDDLLFALDALIRKMETL